MPFVGAFLDSPEVFFSIGLPCPGGLSLFSIIKTVCVESVFQYSGKSDSGVALIVIVIAAVLVAAVAVIIVAVVVV